MCGQLRLLWQLPDAHRWCPPHTWWGGRTTVAVPGKDWALNEHERVYGSLLRWDVNGRAEKCEEEAERQNGVHIWSCSKQGVSSVYRILAHALSYLTCTSTRGEYQGRVAEPHISLYINCICKKNITEVLCCTLHYYSQEELVTGIWKWIPMPGMGLVIK